MTASNHEISTPLMIGQTWYINRMEAVGYTVDHNGHCFGMSHMSMQAFLAEDMKTFNKRLSIIAKIPLKYFNNDFKGLRQTQQYFIKEGKIEKAKQIAASIIDALAFFDGSSLYQNTRGYQHLFEKQDNLLLQDAAKTMQLLNSNNSPSLISCHTGAYNKEELKQYLTIMAKNLGKNSVALTLASAHHAINLNYDASIQGWLLIDPNHLPGKKYENTDLLTEALLSAYGQKEGLVMESHIYTTNAHASQMHDDFISMESTAEWRELHNPLKLNTVYEDKHSQLIYAVIRNDSLWIQQNLSFDLDLNQADSIGNTPLMHACSIGGHLDCVKLLVNNGAILDIQNQGGTTALMCASSYGFSDIVDILIEKQAKTHLTDCYKRSALTIAIGGKQSEIAHKLIDAIDSTDSLALAVASYLGQLDVMTALIEKGTKPTEEMLNEACKAGNISVITTLMNKGVAPTAAMFNEACRNCQLEIAQLFSKTISRDLIESMGIINTMKKLAVNNELIELSIDAIISNATEEMDALSPQELFKFNSSKLNQSIITHLDTLVHDKNTTLGQFIQNTHNSKTDHSSEKFSEFKVEYNKHADEKEPISICKENKEENQRDNLLKP